MKNVSVVIPAKNEAAGLSKILPELMALSCIGEVLVVDDGSEDATAEVALSYGAKVISSPYSKGNGASIKAGARAAVGEVIIFMDADGQHDPKDIGALLAEYESGYDMLVGARSGSSQASMGRWAANSLYNRLASWMVGRKVEDLTSGFRVVNANKFREFLHLLPNGFSYPTTITMAFFRAGYNVGYKAINVEKRLGKSHISLSRDGIRFLLIIFKIGTLYSPLKIFFPTSVLVGLVGLSYYLFTYITQGRFTNMSALMFTTSLIVFMMGLISEQITSLIYKHET
ncbi:glycosyltransferase family 2 protein [Pseudomaricurvus sp. HS19]|uniref:glycosyltransferase family 2 protein n=1 Tax=Pseudomaricurvus sp. HS19 TaxID=2692626 RepID=UPI00136F0EF6|nr:glycosyltransferase family 2 protein [Pseudomaricurvus sp. HS19]MYM64706.1 glycosyltransferase [Pseudomaricurvus sp. HS19]